jgi:outer membrane receptor protein involved in Fe transport
VAGALVSLEDPLGRPILAVRSDGDGRFLLRGVAPGVYHLEAEAPPLRSTSHRIAVSDGLPLELELRLSPGASESLVVSGEPGGAGASGVTLAGEAVRAAPSPLRSQALRAAVAATPGWTSEDNGLMHFRGADDGMLFVLDGVPVYERLDPQFGVGFDPLTLASVHVVSGFVPPAHGLRSGGVIEVRSQAGSLDTWSGALEAGAGSHASGALSGLVQGPLGRETSLTLSGGGERTRRYLDAVSPDNLHNHGGTGGGEGELVWAPGRSVLSLRGGHARSTFDVPNTEVQEAAGQDQRQENRHSFGTLNWQGAWSRATVSQLALFGRFTDARIVGSPRDTPLSPDADRSQGRLGVIASLTHERGRHRFKGGFELSQVRLDERFSFFVTDVDAGVLAGLSEEALRHDAGDPFEFAGSVVRPIVSFHLQDSWRASDRLTIDAGVRFDRSRLLLTESQWSPRLGIAWRAGRATLRASLNRFFQPPQTEYLLLSSSPEAHALSPFAELGGGADVPSERMTGLEAGAELQIGNGLRADLALWRRSFRNQGDPNVFFGTTILFPNSVAEGRAGGLDLRLELVRREGLAGSLSYTLAKIEQTGPINGGLFLEDDIPEIGPGTLFTPDHDQRHALTAELRYGSERRGLWVALGGRYRSGTPLQVDEADLDELAERPGSELVDLEKGRVRPYAVFDVQAGQRLLKRRRFELGVRAALLNVTDARYAYNFGNPFSGTHFGAPRSARLELRLALR